jgi:hypothetical protein
VLRHGKSLQRGLIAIAPLGQEARVVHAASPSAVSTRHSRIARLKRMRHHSLMPATVARHEKTDEAVESRQARQNGNASRRGQFTPEFAA